MLKSVERFSPMVQNEVYLRSSAIAKLQSISLEKKNNLTEHFNRYYEIDTSVDIVEFFIKAILSAERSQKWENSVKVNMGFYFRTGEFYALFFHECTHHVLGSLTVAKYNYVGNFRKEEVFCWYFSRVMCETLSLDYYFLSEVVNKISMFVLSSFLIKNKNLSIFSYSLLQFLEKVLLGYNDEVIGNIEWNESGQPFLK